MRLHVLTRFLVVAASLLMGMGPSVSALAHGSAHAHEAEHRASEPVNHDRGHGVGHDHGIGHDFGTAPALADAPDAHHHEHPHAMVDAGLKSRADALPFVASSAATLPPVIGVKSLSLASRASNFVPPPQRHFSPSSPRAPPAR